MKSLTYLAILSHHGIGKCYYPWTNRDWKNFWAAKGRKQRLNSLDFPLGKQERVHDNVLETLTTYPQSYADWVHLVSLWCEYLLVFFLVFEPKSSTKTHSTPQDTNDNNVITGKQRHLILLETGQLNSATTWKRREARKSQGSPWRFNHPTWQVVKQPKHSSHEAAKLGKETTDICWQIIKSRNIPKQWPEFFQFLRLAPIPNSS